MNTTEEGVLDQSPPKQVEPDVEKQHEEASSADYKSVFKSLGFLDQFLALWIFLAMVVGILLGNFVPSTGPALQKGKFVGVSIPIGTSPYTLSGACVLIREVAIGLLVMMYPILCKIRFETLHHSFRARTLWIQVGFSIFVNWIVAPFLMVST